MVIWERFKTLLFSLIQPQQKNFHKIDERTVSNKSERQYTNTSYLTQSTPTHVSRLNLEQWRKAVPKIKYEYCGQYMESTKVKIHSSFRLRESWAEWAERCKRMESKRHTKWTSECKEESRNASAADSMTCWFMFALPMVGIERNSSAALMLMFERNSG